MMKSFLKVHYSTYIVLFLALIMGLYKYVLIIFSIVLFHEFGHIFIAKLFKRKIVSLTILPFGGMTKLDGIISSSIYEDLLISIGGFLFQLVLGTILYIFNKYNIISYKLYEVYTYYNRIIILFNLIPLYPLDGYKIVNLFMELVLPYKIVLNYGYLITFINILILYIYDKNIIYKNSMMFIFIGVLVIEFIKNKKYLLNRFYLERMNYHMEYKLKNINRLNGMFKNRYHYINRIREEEYIKKYYYKM